MDKLEILVADHSVVSRKNITDIVNATDFGMVTRSASGGGIALEWLEQSRFDVILLDVSVVREMGVDQIAVMKRRFPGMEVIIMSDNDSESAAITLESMNYGALDFVLRPNGKASETLNASIRGELDAIFTQIKVHQYLPKPRVVNEAKTSVVKTPTGRQAMAGIDLVLIASSTGGPVALETICRNMPADFKKPILIVQHMPPEFTHVLAASFSKKFKRSVTEGKTGDLIKPGSIIIAPGGLHMEVDMGPDKLPVVRLLETPFENGVRPSADVLFRSVAKVYKARNVLVVVLTGMGNDGTKGVQALKDACNCYTITQSEATCVVYGMPKCVYDAGLSDEAVNLEAIAQRICQITHCGGAASG